MNKEHKVSLFPSLYKYESEETTLEEIIILIRRRRWVREITAYRHAVAEGRKEEAVRLKRFLPGSPAMVRGSGRVPGDDQVAAYSMVVGLDFDHVENLAVLIALFRSMPTTLALFVSPGGEGLKVFVRVDSGAEHHRRAFEVVTLRYEEVAGMASDRKCRNIGRCCYVSDDPEAYYNPDAEVFHVAVEMPQAASGGNRGMTDAGSFVSWWAARNPLVEGSRNQTVYNLGCEANRRGFPEAEIARLCVSLMQAPSFSAQEIGQALHSAYQSHTGEYGTKVFANGQIADRTAPMHLKYPNPSENGPGKRKGKELRKQTPCLPDDLLEKLPPVIREAVRYYADVRERDMGVLAACTVLSACLPGVHGYYRRKWLTPHLYTVEVAPAANGKGCVDEMRHLADHYATLIKTESEREVQEYQQALDDWEAKKAELRGKHKSMSVKDAPKPAYVRYLVVSGQVTKAKLLVHLRDNGEAGLLIVDSEIDTLITATKQDYGQFDDLLRKAFHHEPVSSSRKGDNEMILVDRPTVASCWRVTPGSSSPSDT